ncbi:hypothetical protein DRN77_07690 [Methanosarcinales archaeon]|nr:MAG: hypothetical protein DRN77_07690 [Methanosarcinales archaeon]
MSDLSNRLKIYLLEEGADLVGITSADSFESALEGCKPTDILEDARSVITMAVSVNAAGVEKAKAMAAWRGKVFPLDELAFKASRLLFREGYKAIVVPSATHSAFQALKGEISHKHAAVMSGLGCIGKCSLLVTPRFGTRVALISVITDAILTPDEAFEGDLCGDCSVCIDVCPVEGTINEEKKDGYYMIMKAQCVKCYKCYTSCPVGMDEVGH